MTSTLMTLVYASIGVIFLMHIRAGMLLRGESKRKGKMLSGFKDRVTSLQRGFMSANEEAIAVDKLPVISDFDFSSVDSVVEDLVALPPHLREGSLGSIRDYMSKLDFSTAGMTSYENWMDRSTQAYPLMGIIGTLLAIVGATAPMNGSAASAAESADAIMNALGDAMYTTLFGLVLAVFTSLALDPFFSRDGEEVKGLCAMASRWGARIVDGVERGIRSKRATSV